MGNVGIMHGWMLSQAGFDVTHVVRKGTTGRFAGGVKMDVLDLRGDALIAATASEHDLTLCASNAKHFRPIRDLKLRVFKP